jgi:hypothetical protein
MMKLTIYLNGKKLYSTVASTSTYRQVMLNFINQGFTVEAEELK